MIRNKVVVTDLLHEQILWAYKNAYFYRAYSFVLNFTFNTLSD